MYHLALIDMEKAYRAALSHYRGRSAAEVDEQTVRWFDEHVVRHLQPGGKSAIEEHRQAGHHLILLTSSSAYEARAATRAFAMHDFLANHFPVDENGALTGEVISPLCYGPGKVTHAETWAKRHDVDLTTSYFYSDSLSDLPMLERVGNPRVVNPDPRLARVAKRRQWPILRWDLAGPPR
jgi:HAD superfamily hydrolase (TIGR01490 family)